MKTSLVVVLAALFAVAACGKIGKEAGLPPEGTLCDAVSLDLVAEALGARPQGESAAVNDGSPHPGCSWMAALETTEPRSLVLTVWRKKALDEQGAPASGQEFFEEELLALQADYDRVGGLDDIGDEAFMGVGQGDAYRFEGKIVARKGEDVLSMKIDGKDPAAFETIARQIAAAM